MRLAAIAFLLIAGIFAGAQLGKVAPLVGWYQNELGFSLVLFGWLTSMIGIFVALVALPAGWAIERSGVRRSAVIGSIFLAAGALALPVLTGSTAILAVRLVEGIGYVILVIALPALLTAISPPHWRAPVLAIWSCFVPVGYAVSDLMAQAMLPALSSATYLWAVGIGYVVFAALGLLMAEGLEEKASAAAAARGGISTTLSMPVGLIALSFGLFVIQSLAFFAFMPAFISGGGGLLMSAGLITLMVPIGNVLASVLVGRTGPRGVALLTVLFFVITAAAIVPVFLAVDPMLATVCAVAFVVASGVVGSALYAGIPALVPAGGSVSIAIGLIAQAGGLGTLFGPPIAGWVIETYGWTGLGLFLAACGLLGALAILPNALRTR